MSAKARSCLPDQALANDLAAEAPTAPDTAALHTVADRLDHVMAHGEPEQAKALLTILITELRVNSHSEILPTYRVGAPVVCADKFSGRNFSACEPAADGRTGCWTRGLAYEDAWLDGRLVSPIRQAERARADAEPAQLLSSSAAVLLRPGRKARSAGPAGPRSPTA